MTMDANLDRARPRRGSSAEVEVAEVTTAAETVTATVTSPAAMAELEPVDRHRPPVEQRRGISIAMQQQQQLRRHRLLRRRLPRALAPMGPSATAQCTGRLASATQWPCFRANRRPWALRLVLVAVWAVLPDSAPRRAWARFCMATAARVWLVRLLRPLLHLEEYRLR
jgi:hypothetical protein